MAKVAVAGLRIGWVMSWHRWFQGWPVFIKKGGRGSGHHGHRGSPGRGGSTATVGGLVLDVGATSMWSPEDFESKVLSPIVEGVKPEYLDGLKVRLRGTATEVDPSWSPTYVGVMVRNSGEFFVFTKKPGLDRRRGVGEMRQAVAHELGHYVGEKSGIAGSAQWGSFADGVGKAMRRGEGPGWADSAYESCAAGKWNKTVVRNEVFAAGWEWRVEFPAMASDIPGEGLAMIEETLQ